MKLIREYLKTRYLFLVTIALIFFSVVIPLTQGTIDKYNKKVDTNLDELYTMLILNHLALEEDILLQKTDSSEEDIRNSQKYAFLYALRKTYEAHYLTSPDASLMTKWKGMKSEQIIAEILNLVGEDSIVKGGIKKKKEFWEMYRIVFYIIATASFILGNLGMHFKETLLRNK